MTEQLRNVGYDLIYLMNCALHGTTPTREWVEEMNLPAVHTMAERHSVQAMLYYPLERYVAAYGREALPCSDDLLRLWKEEKGQSVRRSILFDEERQKVYAYMDEAGIWYLPLKGIILQDYYPKRGMRQMADNDILFDPAYRKDIRRFFKKNGYKVTLYGRVIHDTYRKEPFYNFEMHVDLAVESQKRKYPKYRNIRRLLMRQSKERMECRFTDKDFYIHLMMHAYHHWESGGFGLRTLADVAVFTKLKGAALDWEYIHRDLEQLELSDFELEIHQLAHVLFGQEEFSPRSLTAEEAERLDFYIGSGTYGTKENHMKKMGVESDRRGYVRQRLFPPMGYYEDNFPVLYKHRYLIPFFLLFRAVRMLFTGFGRFKNEMRIMKKMK